MSSHKSLETEPRVFEFTEDEVALLAGVLVQYGEKCTAEASRAVKLASKLLPDQVPNA